MEKRDPVLNTEFHAYSLVSCRQFLYVIVFNVKKKIKHKIFYKSLGVPTHISSLTKLLVTLFSDMVASIMQIHNQLT